MCIWHTGCLSTFCTIYLSAAKAFSTFGGGGSAKLYLLLNGILA